MEEFAVSGIEWLDDNEQRIGKGVGGSGRLLL
jgi:hypothetical protein